MARPLSARLAAAAAAILLLAGAPLAWAGPRVMSLDQCADQFVLALAPRGDIAGLSHRADDADSYLRAQARGLPMRRAGLEPVLASRAQVVVRYWGGDESLDRALARRGVAVVRIGDATDFEGVRANVRRVAAALGRPAAGRALIERMDAELAAARGAWDGRPALYLTPAGFTAGRQTLVGAMMTAAGLGDAARAPGYGPVSLERIVADPPAAFVLGFFDGATTAGEHWSVGRHEALRKVMKGRTLAVLPASILGCPAWFAADGAAILAGARRP